MTALDAGRRVLVLVPEIALALPLVDRLRADLAGPRSRWCTRASATASAPTSGAGSGPGRRHRRRDAPGGPGAAPGRRPRDRRRGARRGLQERPDATSPGARRRAASSAGLAGAAVVLGSATPAVESVGLRPCRRDTGRIVLPARPVGQPPVVTVVDLRAELAAGKRGLLSQTSARRSGRPRHGRRRAGDPRHQPARAARRSCCAATAARPGAAPTATRPLVYHQAGDDAALSSLRPGDAPRDPVPDLRVRRGSGISAAAPSASSARSASGSPGSASADWTATSSSAAAPRSGSSTRSRDGRLDVLVGTSLVAKGLDIPEVTLVGVVSADIALNLPDERAAERTYQLLVQAVGRAGRGIGRAGRSSRPTSPITRRSARGGGDRTAFYDAELALRERFGSPPFGRLVKLTVGAGGPRRRRGAGPSDGRPPAGAARRSGAAGRHRPGRRPPTSPAGRNRWRFNLVLRGTDPVRVLGDGVEAPWSVDVDPESLL